ncbi:hypothetical protein FPQ18DRAFT_309838 [Pyronema domesticum]|nr:hypothetical protein FPQ18DRAFT_309838 [Pyronema domesticum]
MSLDKDLARLRRSKYTPEAAAEVSSWIESILGEKLPRGELMDVLKDGTILCKIVNKLGEKPLRFKSSAMPFVQMENIASFLNAITNPPVSLAPHDRFLTVDLFEKKDPAQVLQCLSSFSRVAHNLNPSAFPDTVGGLKAAVPAPPVPAGEKKTLAKPTVSTWSNKDEQGKTAPAWNVAQYGYMGGASQGNQGVMFGGRRQITTAAPLLIPNKEEEVKKKSTDPTPVSARTPAEEKKDAGLERRKREEEAEQKRMEAEKKREDELMKQYREDFAKKQREERDLKAREELERKEKEEEVRKQREEDARLQREEDAKKQREEDAKRRREEEFRKIREEEMKKLREEDERKQREEELRLQREEEQRLKREAEERRKKEEAERLKKEGEERRKKEEEERIRLAVQRKIEDEERIRLEVQRKIEDEKRRERERELEEALKREQEAQKQAQALLLMRERELEVEAQLKEDALRKAAAIRELKEAEVARHKEQELQRQIDDEIQLQHELELQRKHDAEMEAEKRRWAEEAEEKRNTWQRQQQKGLREVEAELHRQKARVRELEHELDKARERERHLIASFEGDRRLKTERMRVESAELMSTRSPLKPQRTGENRYPASVPTSRMASPRSASGGRDSAELEEERKYLQREWARESIATPPMTEPTDSRPPSTTPRALPTPPPRNLPVPTVRHQSSWEKGDDEKLNKDDYSPSGNDKLSWSNKLMMCERQRQKEWERSQMETQKLATSATKKGEEPAYGYADDILDLY